MKGNKKTVTKQSPENNSIDIKEVKPQYLFIETYLAEKERKKTDSKTSKKSKRERFNRRLRNLIIKVLTLVIGVFILTNFIFGLNVIHNNDMYPSLRDGDLVITYRLSKKYVADHVYAYRYEGNTYFGRIIGVPGDVIDITRDGYLKINGRVPYEDRYYDTFPASNSDIKYPYVVPEGSYFLLGDYRVGSSDSRVFGAIPAEDFIGEVALTLRRRGF